MLRRRQVSKERPTLANLVTSSAITATERERQNIEYGGQPLPQSTPHPSTHAVGEFIWPTLKTLATDAMLEENQGEILHLGPQSSH